MQVSSVNNTPNFGHCQGIHCLGEFSKINPDHIIAINEFIQSNAVKQFGEKYDFIAKFKYLPRSLRTDWDGYLYKIDLTPVPWQTNHPVKRKSPLVQLLSNIFHKTQNTEEIKEENHNLPNLPTEISITKSVNESNAAAYEIFLKNIRSLTLFDLVFLLKQDLKANEEALTQTQERDAKAKEALKNIEASNIPVYY